MSPLECNTIIIFMTLIYISKFDKKVFIGHIWFPQMVLCDFPWNLEGRIKMDAEVNSVTSAVSYGFQILLLKN